MSTRAQRNLVSWAEESCHRSQRFLDSRVMIVSSSPVPTGVSLSLSFKLSPRLVGTRTPGVHLEPLGWRWLQEQHNAPLIFPGVTRFPKWPLASPQDLLCISKPVVGCAVLFIFLKLLLHLQFLSLYFWVFFFSTLICMAVCFEKAKLV